MKGSVLYVITILSGLLMFSPGISAEEFPGLINLGNVRLSLSIDNSGNIISCRWPSPGYYEHYGNSFANHLYDSTGESNSIVSGWLLLEGDEYILPDQYHQEMEKDLPLLHAESTWESLGLTLHHTVFVHPELDVIVSHVYVDSALSSNRDFHLRWKSSYIPENRIFPEYPAATIMLRPKNQSGLMFAGEGHGIYSFAPFEDSWLEWNAVIATATGSSQISHDGISTLGKGVWISTTTDTSPERVVIGAEGNDMLLEQTLFLTQVDSVSFDVVLKHDDSCTVFIAFAETRESLDTVLMQIQHQNITQLETEARTYWERLTAPVAFMDDTGIDDLLPYIKQTFHLFRDVDSGAIVEFLDFGSPFWGITPETSAWVSYAFAVEDEWDKANSLLNFQRNTMRNIHTRGKPKGSMPVASYSAGTEATPHVWLTRSGTAWWLGACHHVYRLLPENMRSTFWEQYRDSIKMAGDYLAESIQPRNTAPLPGFDVHHMKDTRSIQADILHYAGLLAALGMYTSFGETTPGLWTQSLNDLETYLAFEQLNQDAAWDIDPSLPLWLDQLIPADNRLWDVLLTTELGWLPMRVSITFPEQTWTDIKRKEIRNSPRLAAQTLLRLRLH